MLLYSETLNQRKQSFFVTYSITFQSFTSLQLHYDAMIFLQYVNQDYRIPSYVNFIIGGVSGALGQTITHPLDVTKVRMQICKLSVRDAITETVQQAGIGGFYLGWSAAFLRQLTYSTTRLGIYNTLHDIGEEYFGRLNFPTMVGIGMVAGVLGSFIGTPTDLAFIRMIGDMNLPQEKRKNYKNAIVALIDIAQKEGVFALWRGALPTMTRAAIVNGTQLGTYSKVKEMLKDTGLFEEGVQLSFYSGMVSGLVMAITSLPVDVAKTRIQNWTEPTKPPGIFPMIIQVGQREGITALWRGFFPYYTRAAPNAIVTMVCLDYFKQLYIRHFDPPT